MSAGRLEAGSIPLTPLFRGGIAPTGRFSENPRRPADCPPWINKYYILDLRPEKSFVRWAVSQGHTVFIISWVNPDARHSDAGWEAYYEHGVKLALDTARTACGTDEANVIGDWPFRPG